MWLREGHSWAPGMTSMWILLTRQRHGEQLMPRIGTALVAVVLTMTVTAATGCAEPERDRSSSKLSPVEASEPAVPPRSASAPASLAAQPPGKTCGEVAAVLSEVMEVSWRLRDDSLSDDGRVGRPGTRKCSAETSSTARSTPALLQVIFYRPQPGYDTPGTLREQVRRRAKGCGTELADLPSGVSYATTCLEHTASTLTSSTTMLVSAAGWISVWVSAKHRASTSAASQAKTFVETASRRGAVSALSLI
jgi:hypothetical protein